METKSIQPKTFRKKRKFKCLSCGKRKQTIRPKIFFAKVCETCQKVEKRAKYLNAMPVDNNSTIEIKGVSSEEVKPSSSEIHIDEIESPVVEKPAEPTGELGIWYKIKTWWNNL